MSILELFIRWLIAIEAVMVWALLQGHEKVAGQLMVWLCVYEELFMKPLDKCRA